MASPGTQYSAGPAAVCRAEVPFPTARKQPRPGMAVLRPGCGVISARRWTGWCSPFPPSAAPRLPPAAAPVSPCPHIPTFPGPCVPTSPSPKILMSPDPVVPMFPPPQHPRVPTLTLVLLGRVGAWGGLTVRGKLSHSMSVCGSVLPDQGGCVCVRSSPGLQSPRGCGTAPGAGRECWQAGSPPPPPGWIKAVGGRCVPGTAAWPGASSCCCSAVPLPCWLQVPGGGGRGGGTGCHLGFVHPKHRGRGGCVLPGGTGRWVRGLPPSTPAAPGSGVGGVRVLPHALH